ncbi:histidine phosphatase family protein [Inhella inkyongensis]
MRHGAVRYFEGGRPLPPESVPLTEAGQAQARAAGRLLAAQGVRPDRVICSGLPRTRQTAALVLGELPGPQAEIEDWPALQEIHGGRLRDIPEDRLEACFTALQRGPLTEHSQFLGGETLGALWDRILPAQLQLRADPDWDCALWVLHGVVNAALLSHWVSGGQRLMLPGWQQNPACINVIDLGADDALLRAVNLNPVDWLQPDERRSTMEQLLADLRQC